MQAMFREEENPKFGLGSAAVVALLLLGLFFLVFRDARLFLPNHDELSSLHQEKEALERELVFRFLNTPEDVPENEDAKFFSDAARLKKSEQSEEHPPENDDPISKGDTLELEQRALPRQQTKQRQESEAEAVAQEVAKAVPEEPRDVAGSETIPEEPAQERVQPSTDLPLVEDGPKPYRKLSRQELLEARRRAQREMNVLERGAVGRPARNSTQFHNPRGSAAPMTGLSIETTRHDLGPYLNILKQLIKSNWRVPSIARFEVSGATGVHFKIHKNGKITDARIISSSSYEPLDTASLNAIVNTYQAPPLPDHIEEAWIPIKFGFFYNMRPNY